MWTDSAPRPLLDSRVMPVLLGQPPHSQYGQHSGRYTFIQISETACDPGDLSGLGSGQVRQVVSDTFGPGIDCLPVAEVSLGQQCVARWKAPDHALR